MHIEFLSTDRQTDTSSSYRHLGTANVNLLLSTLSLCMLIMLSCRSSTCTCLRGRGDYWVVLKEILYNRVLFKRKRGFEGMFILLVGMYYCIMAFQGLLFCYSQSQISKTNSLVRKQQNSVKSMKTLQRFNCKCL